jgi:predicted TIM-barrel fold metal-dependent hydrolase
MATQSGKPPTPARRETSAEIAAFLEAARNAPAPAATAGRGRMIFALDATMSRQPTWDLAQRLQARMFQAAASLGGLDVQLVYFRGFGECRASRFVSGGQGLADLMSRIEVRGGATQLRKVLAHALSEARRAKIGALVFVGDAMEEGVDPLMRLAGELALCGVKAFMFQEGDDPTARRAFQEIARLTGGAYSAFDAGAAARLEALLRAAATYAAGGRAALETQAKGDAHARALLEQMRGT